MTGGLGRRARTPEEMMINMMALAAGDHPGHRNWAPPPPDAPRDVFIACWGKSGTTMMQQMFHQIRMVAATGAGDMNFDDISRMTPWEDTALVLDLDMTATQRAQPRGFKSHREYERLPPGIATSSPCVTPRNATCRSTASSTDGTSNAARCRWRTSGRST